jgi:hypothetical protein
MIPRHALVCGVTIEVCVAAMCGAWLRRNVPQLCPNGSPLLSYLATVD